MRGNAFQPSIEGLLDGFEREVSVSAINYLKKRDLWISGSPDLIVS